VNKLLLIGAAVVSLVGSPATLWTQEGYREGLWMAAGGGPGYAQIDCSRCGFLSTDDAWHGGTGWGGYLAVGSTYGSHLLYGGELNAYLRSSSTRVWDSLYGRERTLERETLLGTAALLVQFYPHSATPAFLKAGLGYGHYALGTRSHLPGGVVDWSHDSSGGALQAGAGYDLLLNRRIALVPFASIVQLLTRSAEWVEGAGPSNPRYVQIGVGVHRY
jgi:hypothetical protein